MINRERIQQRSELRRLFKGSRGSAGSRVHTVIRCAQSERPDIPNLLAREFDVPQPNHVWCGDITYVWASGRWHYLAAVLDLHTRRVVGWAMYDMPDAELAIKALEIAYQRGYPSGVLFHSDQGRQYCSRTFRQRLCHYRMTQSMSRRGNCWDNPSMERLFRSLKSVWLPVTGYRQQKPRFGLTKCPDLVDHYSRR